ncbi:uncharacterized protein Dyak_GE28471, isoform B [Drosophila yakuba]|uniref:Uncharacterized protein, isoform B n=1 Tax=Drosophila yakuba TaxID=7245 RepID=A0A0R1DXU1_DROYA|nr:uncharacterized protein Dyak_GE28471, isoform B [Drosophila yakuba]
MPLDNCTSKSVARQVTSLIDTQIQARTHTTTQNNHHQQHRNYTFSPPSRELKNWPRWQRRSSEIRSKPFTQSQFELSNVGERTNKQEKKAYGQEKEKAQNHPQPLKFSFALRFEKAARQAARRRGRARGVGKAVALWRRSRKGIFAKNPNLKRIFPVTV